MKNNGGLPPESLRHTVDIGELDFETTADLENLDHIIGQDRAVAAVEFGVGIDADGYNIFALGVEGTGKHSLVRTFLREQAKGAEVPDDWVYVNNFKDTYKPKALKLPPGRGTVLHDDMEELVEDLRAAIRAAFESEEFQTQSHSIQAEFKAQPETRLEAIDEKAKERGLTLMRTPKGMAFAPVKDDGEVLPPEEFEALPEERQNELEEAVKELQEELQSVLRRVPRWEREMQDRVRDLSKEVGRIAASEPIDALREKYEGLENVQTYLDAVLEDVVENVQDFLPSDDDDSDRPMPSIMGQDPRVRRYKVNVLVDRSDEEGAPVVYEDHPTYSNLLGRIERTVVMGALLTDFHLIQAGALHMANGGYLMLDARRLLQQPLAWEALKRTLRSGQIRIESLEQSLSLASTVTLEPEPVPLDVKIALLGERRVYYLLSRLDRDFDELFKVQADFDEEMDFASDVLPEYARLIAGLAREKELRPVSAAAVARVIERSQRLAGDKEKLSVKVHAITDVLRESDYWAGQAGRDVIDPDDVQKALDAMVNRADRVRDRMHEAIARNTIVIATHGETTGQINGLSVIGLGGFTFGRPSRISATVAVGSGEVVNIEREVELSGPIHSKGMLILQGYLKSHYAEDYPLSLSASVVFEQSYSGVDGDSASTAELVALLSAIGEVPLRQAYAITGSVSQRGQVQAIGGVNEKIEGWFDVCQAAGLTGDQGVLIPQANVKNLMLRADVVEAVANGQFSVHAVERVDEVIELMTGMPAGQRQADGTFPEDTFNHKVDQRLREFAAARKAFSQAASENGDG